MTEEESATAHAAGAPERPRTPGKRPSPGPRTTLVWIDERLAVVARWRDGEAVLERLESEVPDRRRSTGHVRHDPAVRHGGGGVPQTAGEPHRLEHLARFVEEVASRLPDDEDVLILGPGTVRDQLRRHILEQDGAHRRAGRPGRGVTAEAAARLTEPRLAARLRTLVGQEPRRRR